MATVIEELVSRLGFQIDDKKLDAFNKRSERLKTTLKRIGVVASAAAVGIITWVSRVGVATDANIKFADSVDIAFDALQELQFATEREGGSLQSLQQSLLALSQRAGEAFRGMGEGVQVFGLLGINIRDANGDLKTSDILLEDLADAFQRFDKVQQIEFANKLGISPDLLLLLQKGKDNLKKLRLEARSFGLISEDTARRAEEFQDALTDLKQTARSLFINIAGDLLPTIIKLVQRTSEWFIENKKIIRQKLEFYIKILTKSIDLLLDNLGFLINTLLAIEALKVLGFLTDFVLLIITASRVVLGLNTQLALTNALIGAMPILIGLAIAAFIVIALIIQDLAAMLKGDDSFFGRMAEDSEDARKKVEKLISVFEFFKGVLEFISQVAKDAWESIKSLVTIIESFGDAVVNTFLDKIDNMKLRFQKFKDFIDNFKIPFIGRPGTVAPDVGGSGDNITNTTNLETAITINSQNGDPLAIGEAVAQAIENVARNGINNQPQVVIV